MAFNLDFASRPASAYTVVAVAGLVLSDDKPGTYVIVQNSRGWDIPGGRLEPGETPEAAFERELMEESGHTPTAAPKVLTLLEVRDNPSLGVTIYTARARKTNEFTAVGEITACKLVDPEELVALYFGDKGKLRTLLDMAAKS